MAAPFSLADLGVYDANSFIKNADAGRRDRTLAELGQFAAQGDYKGAEAAAWRGGEPEYASHLAGLSQDQQERLADEAAVFAISTDNEQAWEAARQQWAAKGYELPPFAGRQVVINQAVGATEALRMQRQAMESDRNYQLQLRQENRLSQPKPPEAPDIAEFYDEATGQPYKAQWNPQTRAYERVGGVKAPSNGMSFTSNPDGTMTVTQGGTGGKLTEADGKSALYATRAAGALPLINTYGNSLTDLPQSFVGSTPVVGNYFRDANYQRAEQAGREFLQAILRKDTGAAITKEETAEYGNVYLPRPGDTPEVLTQKAAARDRALQALIAGMPPQAILNAEKALGTSLPSPPVPGGQRETPGGASSGSDPLGIR